MSDHRIALVPLATGYFQSPELFSKGRKADTGLFAESLIYYDSVYVHVDNPEQFASFISLLIQQGLSYENLIELVDQGVVRFFNTVLVMPYMGTGHPKIITSLYSIQEQAMLEPNYFSKRYLEFEGLKNSFSGLNSFDSKTFNKFCRLAEKTAVTFSGENIGDNVIDNAYKDCFNPKRFGLIAKSFYKELYKINGMGKLPNFDVSVRELNSQNMQEIAENTDSTILGRDLGNNSLSIHELAFRPKIKPIPSLEDKKITSTFSHSPVVFAGISNLYVNSAARLKADLFLTNPVSKVVGDKLYEMSDFEISVQDKKIQNIIEKLEAKVEFPNIQQFVNEDKMDFEKVLEIRRKAKKFREWLQSESERDRDAIIAYHNEIAKVTGFSKVKSRTLNIFGVLASGVVGGSVGVLTKHLSEDASLAAIAGSSTFAIASEVSKRASIKVTEKLFDYGANIGSDWKPVVFGKWLQSEISELLEK